MKKIILTVLMSVFTGILSCFFYNTSFMNIHYGLILSLLLILCVAIFIKLNYNKKMLALFSIIIIVLIQIFANYGPFGDDIIIMGGNIGNIFVIFGTLIGPILLLLK